MKKTIVSSLCSILLTGGAYAQGNVTIGGIVDSAVRQVSNTGSGSISSLVSGSNNTSRLFFTGREDLGSGLSASFHLEHGLLVDTGTQSATDKFWDRRSTVSLTSASLGELRLGRDYVPSYLSWSRFDPFSYVGAARSANFVTAGSSAAPTPIREAFGTATNTTVRTDNAVQLLSPTSGGFEGGLLVGAGEGGVVASGNAKVLGGRVGFSSGALHLSAAYTTSKNAQTVAGSFKDWTVGGSFELEVAKLALAWREIEYSNAKQRLLMLAASRSFGPHELKASYVRNDLSGRVGNTAIAANDATQLGIGYVYNLSKRTALYATAARIANDGLATYAVAGTVSTGGSSRAVEAGLRHRF